MKGDVVMASNLWFYQLLLASLVLICLIIHVWWPDPLRMTPPPPLQSHTPRRKRSKEPKPFTGYIHKPLCEACEHGIDSRPQVPGSPPPGMILTRGRKRTVDTQSQFCPDPDCAYHGWLGRGNIRANGHPGGQPWRQLQCVSCRGYFYETHGTIFHGTGCEFSVAQQLVAWAPVEDHSCLQERCGQNNACHSVTV